MPARKSHRQTSQLSAHDCISQSVSWRQGGRSAQCRPCRSAASAGGASGPETHVHDRPVSADDRGKKRQGDSLLVCEGPLTTYVLAAMEACTAARQRGSQGRCTSQHHCWQSAPAIPACPDDWEGFSIVLHCLCWVDMKPQHACTARQGTGQHQLKSYCLTHKGTFSSSQAPGASSCCTSSTAAPWEWDPLTTPMLPTQHSSHPLEKSSIDMHPMLPQCTAHFQACHPLHRQCQQQQRRICHCVAAVNGLEAGWLPHLSGLRSG